MKLEEVKAGKYYYAEYGDGASAYVYPVQDGTFRVSPGYRPDMTFYDRCNCWACDRNIREATLEEANILRGKMGITPEINVYYEIY